MSSFRRVVFSGGASPGHGGLVSLVVCLMTGLKRSMACHPVLAANLSQFWFLFLAGILCQATSGMEMAAPGRVDRAGHIAGQEDALSFTVNYRVRDGHGRE